MSGYIIKGGNPLFGSVTVSGGKNAALPLLTAALLAEEGITTFTNCPSISDVTYTIKILEKFGCEVYFHNGQITVDARKASHCAIPYELTGKLRSASLFLGASSARFNKAEQYISGGCELGSRPIDMHIDAFCKMGIDVTECEDVITCKNSPHGADIFLRFPSVGTTENIIIAASLGKGTVTITNAAREPEICQLCDFINKMGGRVLGGGSSVIIIQGVEKLKGINYNIMGDRIEAMTFMALALATDGEITVKGANYRHVESFADLIINCGGFVCRRGDDITVRRSGHFILSPSSIVTKPYPGFPTDAQSVSMAMLVKSLGETRIFEQIFDDRLKVANQLVKMGADISVSGNCAIVRGVRELIGTELTACDLRSGAALVIAALSATGESLINNICYIQRGYSNFVDKLRVLGADIKITEDV